MGWCPGERGQNIGGIELARRHSQDACNERHEGAHDRNEARQKDARGTVSFDECFAAVNELRISD